MTPAQRCAIRVRSLCSRRDGRSWSSTQHDHPHRRRSSPSARRSLASRGSRHPFGRGNRASPLRSVPQGVSRVCGQLPRDALRLDAVASWIRVRGVTVDAASIDELDLLRRAEMISSQVVMHCHGEVPISIRRAALARFVVNNGEQIAELADNPLARSHRVVVDQVKVGRTRGRSVGTPAVGIGGVAHSASGDAALGDLAESVVSMIAKMAWIRQKHAVLLFKCQHRRRRRGGHARRSAQCAPGREGGGPGHPGRVLTISVPAPGADRLAPAIASDTGLTGPGVRCLSIPSSGPVRVLAGDRCEHCRPLHSPQALA